MHSMELVDPAARPLASAFAEFDPTQQPLAEYRLALANAMSASLPAQMPHWEERWARSGEGQPDVRLLLHRPCSATSTLPAILFIHASGFIAGKPEWSAPANAAMADSHSALVVAVNYRLAPETPFPGPLEDCYAALRWIFENANDQGVDRSRIIVMGESAGGGLAAALAQLARDRGEFVLAAQILVYPMLDPRTGTPDAPADNPVAGEFVWTRRHNRFGWDAMRGGQVIPEARIGHYAPALAKDLAGLPATFIAVGALDLFAEEATAYAMRLTRVRVPTELHLYPGGIHGFDLTDSAIAHQYHTDLSMALDRLLAKAVQSTAKG